ncbi:MAG: M23 family metallopeptidase [Prolixibacteraceae bacterium]|nr:M23 family metallopeptidase [Prolixibacteraceae bacterium]
MVINTGMKSISKKYTLLLLAFLFVFCSAYKCKEKPLEEKSKPCLERAQFGNPEDSEYILPFPAGKKYVCSQSYCNPNGGHSNQLAYDFALQISDTVIAARSGIVKSIREDQPDRVGEITASNHNFIMIEHSDGTVAFYAHLKQNSVFVTIDEKVEQGQIIALSGNSGNTMNFPHLHFGVYEFWPATETYDVPVNFRNAEGPMDSNGGLIADEWYEAK